MTDNTWFIGVWDEIVTEHGTESMTLEESREAVSVKYVDSVKRGYVPAIELDDRERARVMFDRYVMPERTKRKNNFRKHLDYLKAYLTGNPDEEADVTAILDLAMPLGTGSDKALKFWSANDWTTAITSRYRNAAQATASAAEFHDEAMFIVDAMNAHGASLTGDLFGQVQR